MAPDLHKHGKVVWRAVRYYNGEAVELSGVRRVANMNRVPLISAVALYLLVSPLALAGPDLTVSVSVEKGTFDPLKETVPVTYVVSVANIGDAACPAGGFFSDFWPEFTCPTCQPAGGCGGSDTWEPEEFPALPPGGEPYVFYVERDIEPNILPYRYLFYVDSVFNFCPEDNEDNNIACAQYEVSPVAESADFLVEDCLVQPSLEDASMMEFSAKVTNIGSSPSEGAVNVEFFLAKLGDSYDDHVGQFGDDFALIQKGLEPDASVVVTATIPCPADAYEGACVANVFDEMDEPDYQNNIALSEPYQCVEAANNPDLEVISYSASLLNGVPAFQGVFTNQGTVDIEPDTQFKIGIWANHPGGPDINTCPDVTAGEGWIISVTDGIEKGTEMEFAWGSPPLPNGFYESWVVLDCDNEIFEMDEKNNRETDDLLIDQDGPDLRIKDAAYELHEEDKGFHVEVTLWVENGGNMPVEDGFDVDIFWDVEQPPSWQEAGKFEGAYSRFKEPLAPQAVRQVTFVWAPVGGIPQGLYSSWIVLDITGEVYETVEANNTYHLELDVPEYIDGLPNVGIDTFSVKATGNTAHFFTKVCNTGVKAIKKPFKLDLFVDQEGQPIMGDQGDLALEVAELAVGECAEWPIDREDVKDGEYRAYLIVDSKNAIEEAVEGDNMAGPRIYVVCGSCDACPEGVYVTQPGGCYCGGATVNYGFCCEDEWYAVGCPSGNVETEADSLSAEVNVVEFGGGGFGASPGTDCGCRTHRETPPDSLPVALVMLLLVGVYWGLRRA